MQQFQEWWQSLARGSQMAVGGGAALSLIVLVLVAVLALGGGGDDPPAVVAATQTPSPPRTPTRTPTPTPTPTETPELTGEAGATVSSIAALHTGYGEPPDTSFARFRIPVLGLDAPVGTRFVGGDGQMPTPTGPSDVVWYDFSAWAGYGGSPGGGRNAVFSGHVDYAANVAYADVYYRGKGVFQSIGLLSAGDTIEVEIDGTVLTYAVEWRRQVNASAAADWANVLSGNVTQDSITLITCGGEFDFTSRSYEDRVVVRAVRV